MKFPFPISLARKPSRLTKDGLILDQNRRNASRRRIRGRDWLKFCKIGRTGRGINRKPHRNGWKIITYRRYFAKKMTKIRTDGRTNERTDGRRNPGSRSGPPSIRTPRSRICAVRGGAGPPASLQSSYISIYI